MGFRLSKTRKGEKRGEEGMVRLGSPRGGGFFPRIKNVREHKGGYDSRLNYPESYWAAYCPLRPSRRDCFRQKECGGPNWLVSAQNILCGEGWRTENASLGGGSCVSGLGGLLNEKVCFFGFSQHGE